ncbi:MAG TPA: ATP-binding protein [Spirochaetota bacterium]|nr:ATP-binding protein [Spirochaetota bacterium]HOM38629.1 ATP-binding protein [Spirochaetota bacterium]HPQ49766.1 ATP-binding protein [Spirochaetota bacterium]
MEIIRNAFLQDIEDYVEDMTYIISKISDGINDEMINNIFRIFHSIKASTNILGYRNLSNSINEIENIINNFKSKKIDINKYKNIVFDLQDIILELKSFIMEKKEDDTPLKNDIDFKIKRIKDTISIKEVRFLLSFSSDIMKICDPLAYIKILKKNFDIEVFPIKDIPTIENINPVEYYTKWEIVSKSNIDISEIKKVFEFLDEEYYKIDIINNVKEEKRFDKKVIENNGNINKEIKYDFLKVSSRDIDILLDILNEITSIFSTIKGLTGDERILDVIESADSNIFLFQQILTNMRLVSLEPLLYQFYRVVNEYSNKVGKSINLKIIGADILVDKSIFDIIETPLNHIIRNAIDHGIEYQDERLKKGKSQNGNIIINCYTQENNIIIGIKDDGRGIDIEKIKEKAKKNGLKYVESDIMNLIFEPGFSTTDEITEYSGRGFGLDIVKENIRKVMGDIEVKTKKDFGTEFIIKLPISLFITDAIIFLIGNQKYAIPVNYVDKIIKFNKINSISKLEGKLDMARIDDKFYPIIYLDRVFSNVKYSNYIDKEKSELLVFNIGNGFAIFTDKIIGQEKLFIKGTPAITKIEDSIVGCSLLDGALVFVLDIFSLYKKIKSRYNFYVVNNEVESFMI